MTPFLHFRSWLRSGPAGERGLTGTAAVVLLGLVIWASVPFSPPPSQGILAPVGDTQTPGNVTSTAPATSGQTTGSLLPAPGGARSFGTSGAPSGTAGGTAPSTGGSTTSAGTGGATTTAGTGSTGSATPPRATSCGTPGVTDQGVTATTVTIGIIIVDLGAAGNALALPSAADQRKAHTAVLTDINNKGGIGCRKLVAKFYTDSTIDASAEHSLCLQMAQDKLFAVYNNFFQVSEQTCVAKQHIPNIWFTPPHTGDVQKYSPNILSWQPDFDALIHQYIAGAKQVGYFTGMKKLGILEGSCYPDENVALVKELKAVGIDPNKASVFNYGCPASPAAPNPTADQQAALQFKRDGVTHVVNVAYGNDANVAGTADGQGYHPKFAKMEDASASGLEASTQKPPKSFAGTLLITTIQTGAPGTPGYVHNGPTKACTKLLAAVGLPAAYSPGLNGLFGIACINGAMLSAASAKAPTLTRASLAAGLAQVGQLELPYPAGPIHMKNPKVPTGGQLARPGVWVSECSCWKLTSLTWKSY